MRTEHGLWRGGKKSDVAGVCYVQGVEPKQGCDVSANMSRAAKEAALQGVFAATPAKKLISPAGPIANTSLQ
jgi:hypothetical protein